MRRERQLIRHPCELRQGISPHFFHHLGAVHLDGDLTDAKVARDLLVEAPRYDTAHDFTLARGERFETFRQCAKLLFILPPLPVPSQAELNRIEQILISEWLGQEFNRPSLHRLDGHRNISMPGDENDGELDT